MRALVLAEHDNRSLKPATAAAVAAAAQLGGTVDVLVAGCDAAAAAAAAAKLAGVRRVLVADDAAFAEMLAEPAAALIVGLAADYDALLAPATATGKNVMPRVAALLDVQQISEIVAVVAPDTFVRPIYAGNALATVKSTDAKLAITVRTPAFAPAEETGAAEIVAVAAPADGGASRFLERRVTESVRPDLTAARVVVAGGRGIGSDGAFALVSQLADVLGGAVGASRAAVDAGFIPNDAQVGQTGKIVAPDLYIAVGISGAIQHLAGMKDSKVIVAINKDAEAPIFQVADYGLVADVFEAVPALIARLNA
ncbi:Electron transfer flavoprotein subunit alpha [uncultured Alphaproteobacteria bacterium]|uniref:Electron transfer flavoprotein subunit alpha n=1 Tax=uncultured Alphaproteobacteria bacterium TaxID=91750 RepID=A0A212JTW9_9PROT|nr:Electron transfer flavoprotein subunit alpha [uncultured Alphaproteobacteria bacterium]